MISCTSVPRETWHIECALYITSLSTTDRLPGCVFKASLKLLYATGNHNNNLQINNQFCYIPNLEQSPLPRGGLHHYIKQSIIIIAALEGVFYREHTHTF